MAKNRIVRVIENCCDCGNSYVEKIYTPDSFEHEEGLFCGKMHTGKIYPGTDSADRLICADDWDLRKYAEIPDWCPLLEKEGKSDE